MSYVTDHFQLLSGIGECIARQFGADCEVVLHDLTRPYDNTIVAIWNGHVTGRSIGGGGTDAGLKILRGTAKPTDQCGYINRAQNGKLLRSTSKYIFDDSGSLTGSLCINYDISGLMAGQTAMMNLLQNAQEPQEAQNSEVFAVGVDDLLEHLLENAVLATGREVQDLTREDKIAIVKNLDTQGAFLIKKSIDRVAEVLNISRYTVYNYLNLKETCEGKP